MQKHKIDMSKYADMHEEKVIKGEDGTEITIRNRIPYIEKEAMAKEMAEYLLIIHDDSCIYLSSQLDKYEKYMIAKYYTDIDTEDADENEVADFLINNELMNEIGNYIWNDFDAVMRMFDALEDSVTKIYEDDKGLTKALRTSFGFLFTGEDVSESLAHITAEKGVIFDALKALSQVEKKKEETIDRGHLTVGGNVINFAKKTE